MKMTWRDSAFTNSLEGNVLVIGAGGIGCELLKNLAMTGFKNITVIDLDTIDISNLNRQFLFRKEHVGKSKAEVASAAIKELRPEINITYFHDSILSEKFGVDFFKKFLIVLSALDNKAARSHVNRLCLVSGVPLVESGSAGYLGQVSVILKGKSECYDCIPKAAQKTYPNCTIRNTPSEPIHCVVWAKALFNQLFGEKDPDNDVAPEVEDHSAENQPVGVGEASESKQRISTRTFAENCDYDPIKLFNKLFYDDIHYLLLMTDLWKERKKPVPKSFDDITSGGLGPSKELGPNMPWSLNKWAEIYENAVYALHRRYQDAVKSNGVLSWDKDDEPAMNFVAACSNIRSNIFQIPTKTLFDVKSMAGNIIPAIATTNACVAGMIVIEALKIVRNDTEKSRCVFIARQPNPRGKILVDEKPCKPNPKCYVCSEKREAIVKVNLEKMLVKHFRQNILIRAFNMISPDVSDFFSKRVIISSEEGETDDLMDKSLSSLGVQNGTQFDCDDFVQHLQFKLIVFHSNELDVEQFELVSSTDDIAASTGAEAMDVADTTPKNGHVSNGIASVTSANSGNEDEGTSPEKNNGSAVNGSSDKLFGETMSCVTDVSTSVSVLGAEKIAVVEVDSSIFTEICKGHETKRKRMSAQAEDNMLEKVPSKRVRGENLE